MINTDKYEQHHAFIGTINAWFPCWLFANTVQTIVFSFLDQTKIKLLRKKKNHHHHISISLFHANCTTALSIFFKLEYSWFTHVCLLPLETIPIHFGHRGRCLFQAGLTMVSYPLSTAIGGRHLTKNGRPESFLWMFFNWIWEKYTPFPSLLWCDSRMSEAESPTRETDQTEWSRYSREEESTCPNCGWGPGCSSF